jgi:hypothetical protein
MYFMRASNARKRSGALQNFLSVDVKVVSLYYNIRPVDSLVNIFKGSETFKLLDVGFICNKLTSVRRVLSLSVIQL